MQSRAWKTACWSSCGSSTRSGTTDTQELNSISLSIGVRCMNMSYCLVSAIFLCRVPVVQNRHVPHKLPSSQPYFDMMFTKATCQWIAPFPWIEAAIPFWLTPRQFEISSHTSTGAVACDHCQRSLLASSTTTLLGVPQTLCTKAP